MAEGHFGHLDGLPDDVRDSFMWLCQEMANLALKWRLYLDLFGEEETRGLLQDTADQAFHAIEESIRVDVTITISRMADPVTSSGKENLSFAKIAKHFEDDAALKAEIETFQKACEPMLTLRHKLIAHNDLKTKLDPENNLLPGIGRPDIETIIASAAKALNIVAGDHAATEMRFDVPSHSDGKSLLFWLRKGWDSQDGEN
jgi:hypothetical protein